MADDDADRFKEAFKRYKKKTADLGDVIDLSQPSHVLDPQVIKQEDTVIMTSAELTELLGLIPVDQWRIYTLTSTPGVFLIPNPFRESGQHYWWRRCLVDYPCLPNVTSLDAHIKREGTGKIWVGGGGGGGGGEREKELVYRLRWTTLGYHYDWNTKEYYEERKSQFPSDLAKLSSFILEAAGFPRFSAEAAIVNYYHLDSTLSGHTDHSEKDLSCPLLSISLGQSAVFLVGGETKAVKPQAILIHSGDVVIMSGPSRLAYHGIPKIISPSPASSSSSPVPPYLNKLSLKEYLQKCRDPVKLCVLRGGGGGGELLCNVCKTKRETEKRLNDTSSFKTFETAISECSRAAPPNAKRPKLEEEDEERDREKACVCHQWLEMVEEWTEFEPYIATSRINVNIRQVNKQQQHVNDDGSQ